MKKILFLLMSLVGISAQAQQKFVLEGTVDPDITDSCYNIYLGDEYLFIDSLAEPTACVPVVDKKFHYEVELDRVTAARVQCIFPGGQLCSAYISLTFVPGETMTLHVHNGHYSADYPNGSQTYNDKILRGFKTLRKQFGWQSPHMPRIKGTKWVDPQQSNGTYNGTKYIKEVIFSSKETVLRIATDEPLYNFQFDKTMCLEDEQGHLYKMIRPVYGDEGNQDQDVRLMGAMFAFEPLPKGTQKFSFHSNQTEIKDIAPATKQKPNFTLHITASEDIKDNGYLIYSTKTDRYGNTTMLKLLDGVSTDKKRQATFSTHLDGIQRGVVAATFPDGSICNYVMKFPLVPNSKAELKVMDGMFYLSGTGFYDEWAKADAVIEDARKNTELAATEAILKRYLKEHAIEGGCVSCFLHEQALPKEVLVDLLPEEAKLGSFAKEAADEVRIAKLQKEAEERRAKIEKEEKERMAKMKDDYKPNLEPYRKDMTVGKPVDLGLSILWADMNLGAQKAEEAGMYFTWGDPEPVTDNSSRHWYNYRWSTGTAMDLRKYNTKKEYGKVDMLTTIQPEDDAATQLWQGDWRMPTMEEMEELRVKCSWEQRTENGVKGYRVTGPNGNSIFLPAAGCLNFQGLYGVGVKGYYWTSSLSEEAPSECYYLAQHMDLGDLVNVAPQDRYAGRCIRPVCSKKNK